MFDSMFDELKEVKYFKDISRVSYDIKYFKEIKRLKSAQKAVVYLEPKRTSTMGFFCE